jgi:hypothetical protein
MRHRRRLNDGRHFFGMAHQYNVTGCDLRHDRIGSLGHGPLGIGRESIHIDQAHYIGCIASLRDVNAYSLLPGAGQAASQLYVLQKT